MSSLSLSDFEFRRVPKNRAHLPRTSPGFRSIMPSSSRMYCELTFRVPSMFRDSITRLLKMRDQTRNAADTVAVAIIATIIATVIL